MYQQYADLWSSVLASSRVDLVDARSNNSLGSSSLPFPFLLLPRVLVAATVPVCAVVDRRR